MLYFRSFVMSGVIRCVVLALSLGPLAWAQTPGNSRSFARLNPNGPARSALLIGNQNYRRSPLRNPANDARDLGESLGKLGFQTVILIDSGKQQILSATRTFAASLAPGDIG